MPEEPAIDMTALEQAVHMDYDGPRRPTLAERLSSPRAGTHLVRVAQTEPAARVASLADLENGLKHLIDGLHTAHSALGATNARLTGQTPPKPSNGPASSVSPPMLQRIDALLAEAHEIGAKIHADAEALKAAIG